MSREILTATTKGGTAYSDPVQATANFLLRYGLVLVIGWFGAMKFTAFEAAAIQPLVASSPLVSWMYQFLSLQAVSNVLGCVEISIAILIGMRPLSAKVSAVGSGLAVLMFFTTLTFLISLPGWEPSLGGFPALNGSGGFLLKDLILLGASVWSLGEALTASGAARRFL
jgi:reactive chlorine resistance protein C